MPNESKIGMLAGVAVFLVVAVFFQGKPAAARPTSTGSPRRHRTRPNGPRPRRSPRPGDGAVGRSFDVVADRAARVQPVSRDPLLWP